MTTQDSDIIFDRSHSIPNVFYIVSLVSNALGSETTVFTVL